jgi:hypothetical protein
MFPRKDKREFKKGLDSDESRRKRQDLTVQLRKQQRDEQVAQRRRVMGAGAAGPAPSAGGQFGDTAGSASMPVQRSTDTHALVAEPIPDLPQLVRGAFSDDPELQLRSVTEIRRKLSVERNPPIDQVISTGVTQRLVRLLMPSSSPALQFEAAWALTNIASGTSEHTRIVVDCGAVPMFVDLLNSDQIDVCEQAVWALGNIAGDSFQYRDLVLRTGALTKLMNLCNPRNRITLVRNATWAISNLCRGKPQPPFEQVAPALTVLAQLIRHDDTEVLTDACWALSYISDDAGSNNQKIQTVLSYGVTGRLVELLAHRSPNVKTPALRTIGNIVTGDDLQTDHVIRCNALGALAQLLHHPKKGIKKEACWTISNITAGNHEQIERVREANIFPLLVELLQRGEPDVKKEAAWAISNATSGGTDEQIRYLVRDAGVLRPMCDLLLFPDPKVVLIVLEGLDNILAMGQRYSQQFGGENRVAEDIHECKGLEKIEQLQEHPNNEIYEKAKQILSQYFIVEEESVAALAPSAAGGQFGFGGPGAGAGAPNFDFSDGGGSGY